MKKPTKVYMAWGISRKDDRVVPFDCYWKQEDAWAEIDRLAQVAPPDDRDSPWKWFGVKELEVH